MRSWVLVSLLFTPAAALVAFDAGCGASSFEDAPGDGSDAGSSQDGAASDGTLVSDSAPPGCNLGTDPKDSLLCLSEDLAIFVSENGADSNAGTKASPVRTIAAGLAKVSSSKKRLYVCAGDYNEPVTIDATHDGVSLYGGWSCTDWHYTGTKALVKSTDPSFALRLIGLRAKVVIADMQFTAPPAIAAKVSSVAALVTDAQEVVLRRVKLIASDGFAGADGTTSTVSLARAENGNDSLGLASDGSSKACTCSDGLTTGGAGGKPPIGKGSKGAPDLDAGPPNNGAGGTGGLASCSLGGTGNVGADGANGAAGANASSHGTVVAAGWTPSVGKFGSQGTLAQGGGGGGAVVGGGGGGGACGGCGGDFGGGGGGGGGSLALVSVASIVTLEACLLTPSQAKAGGKGGDGQPGQLGGAGGAGLGCFGGNGGNGGNGGPGGGGAGGISVGVLYKGPKPTIDTATMIVIPAGAAGSGGTAGLGGSGTGTPGVAQPILEVP